MSSLVVSAVGLSCKALLNSAVNLHVQGLPILLDALNDTEARKSRGVVTISNHISTLDDPITWGILPTSHYLRSRTMTRWSLGASDICFTNPLFSAFFRLGQVLETFRGKGIYQKSVDTAIHKLNAGEWIHLFGEGKVNQPIDYPVRNGLPHLPRFKWGVGRIVCSTHLQPLIIPMWLSGFDHLMPEGRSFPYKFIPRIASDVNLSITFGQPIQSQLPRVSDHRVLDYRGQLGVGHLGQAGNGDGDVISGRIASDSALDLDEKDRLGNFESATTILHDAVQALGRSVDSRFNTPIATTTLK